VARVACCASVSGIAGFLRAHWLLGPLLPHEAADQGPGAVRLLGGGGGAFGVGF
jgi:hypothetical protein